jgi:hypothetical protein
MIFATRIAASVATTTLLAVTAAAQDSLPDAIYYDLPGMTNVMVTSDVTYRTVNEKGRAVALTMDVYRPTTARRGQRFPALVFVHGGLTLDQPRTAKDWGFTDRGDEWPRHPDSLASRSTTA